MHKLCIRFYVQHNSFKTDDDDDDVTMACTLQRSHKISLNSVKLWKAETEKDSTLQRKSTFTSQAEDGAQHICILSEVIRSVQP